MNDMTGLDMLRQRLTSEFPYVSIDTARRMASQPDATWHTVVRKYVDDPDPSVRVVAAKLIAPFDRDMARRSLESLLLADDPVFRDLAGQAMVQGIAGDFGELRRFLRSASPLTRVTAAGRVLELTR
jgi:hypothetical protein